MPTINVIYGAKFENVVVATPKMLEEKSAGKVIDEVDIKIYYY
jgi:hypothetical protein